jgi:hypothetical protein
LAAVTLANLLWRRRLLEHAHLGSGVFLVKELVHPTVLGVEQVDHVVYYLDDVIPSAALVAHDCVLTREQGVQVKLLTWHVRQMVLYSRRVFRRELKRCPEVYQVKV